jgi:hypothetical protein
MKDNEGKEMRGGRRRERDEWRKKKDERWKVGDERWRGRYEQE